jgi:histidinol-phosphate aminotransferase
MAILRKTSLHTYAPKQRTTIDLSVSENPLGCSASVKQAIVQAIGQLHRYPDSEEMLIALLAENHRISPANILLGAGANQILADLLMIFARGKGIVVPSAHFPESIGKVTALGGYAESVPLNGDMSLNFEALLEVVKSDTALIHLCNPNNPTGIWSDLHDLRQLADRSPVPLLISEAGADFIGETLADAEVHPNILVVRSFSKAYALAGLRIGYLVAAKEVIASMKNHLGSYRTNSIAIAAAMAAVQDHEFLKLSVDYILAEKAWLMREMSMLGFEVVPSQGQNFIAKVYRQGAAQV